MERYDIEKLRSLPCEGVAQRLGLTVKHHKALCPFHDDHTPSMTFKGHKYKCWSCGESGDSISLVQKVLGKSFLDACQWLADEHNVVVSSLKVQEVSGVQEKPFDASRFERYFERPFLNNEARKFLFEERRLDPRVVRWCRLTSWRDKQGTPWLQIPYYDQQGKLIGIQNRNLTSPGLPEGEEGLAHSDSDRHSPPSEGSGEVFGGGVLPRFRFPQGSQCGIYNLPVLNLLRPGDELFITEGCSDCWAMLSAGHKAIAIPSATLLSRKDKELLATVNSSGPIPEDASARSSSVASDQRSGAQGAIRFGMYPDNDVPGERLFLQLKEVLPSLVRYQLPPGHKDFADYYVSTQRKEDCP